MKISELIENLNEAKNKLGDIPIYWVEPDLTDGTLIRRDPQLGFLKQMPTDLWIMSQEHHEALREANEE